VEKMEIFKRRPKFTYSFCAVCMQIVKENASDVNASYSAAAAAEERYTDARQSDRRHSSSI